MQESVVDSSKCRGQSEVSGLFADVRAVYIASIIKGETYCMLAGRAVLHL